MTTIQFDQQDKEEALTGIGSVLEPLFTWRGMNVYPVFGSEGDDTDGGGGDGEPGDDPDGDGDGEGNDGSGSDDQAVSREDFDKLRNQLSAADKARAAAEKKAKELEDAKKDDFTKATERVKELEDVTSAQAKEIGELRLQNAFLAADHGITWHDPGDALALAERQGYLEGVVGEDGKVDGKALTAKLKELAKAKPHLVKKGSDSNGGSGGDKPPASGGKVGNGKKSGGDDTKLPSRYDKYINT